MQDEKKPKIGPKEQALRDLQAARIAKNKKIIDKNVREIGATFKVKGKPPKGKIVKVVQFKKRGRTSR